ncbi:MAG: methyltransferase domain-containing protein [Acidobacteria bacterium]|nr:methyltransferase domain-containing protein [Acidobacteriota bacterium]MDW7984478.1 methyltransferase domain-containing protein [Acidobacteriota bacterium]
MAHPFDTVATVYDAQFTDRPLGRRLRAFVWECLERVFQPGDRVIDLGCGTGEDAVWLARRGISVTAVDASATILDVARQKAEAAGVADHIKFVRSWPGGSGRAATSFWSRWGLSVCGKSGGICFTGGAERLFGVSGPVPEPVSAVDRPFGSGIRRRGV